MRWRLGLRHAAADARCTHQYTNQRKQCGSLLDSFMDHAVLCKVGPGVYRTHNMLAHKLREYAKEAGCEAETEVTVPSLLKGQPGTTKTEEARLDVHVWAGGSWPMEAYVDVTTRHPWASRYQQEALADTKLAPTATERKATAQKEARYAPAVDGIPIIVAVLGSWGRLSKSLIELLELLSRRAAHARADAGVRATGRHRRWVEEIAVAQQRCLHRQFATAMQTACHSPSTGTPTDLA